MYLYFEFDLVFASTSTGIKHELQMNDLSDYGTRDQFAEKICRNVIKVEGHPVGH